MSWMRIRKVNGRRVILVCPKRSYRIPAYLKECADCQFMIKRNPTHVLCNYKESALKPEKN